MHKVMWYNAYLYNTGGINNGRKYFGHFNTRGEVESFW